MASRHWTGRDPLLQGQTRRWRDQYNGRCICGSYGYFPHGVYFLCVVSRREVMGWERATGEVCLETCKERRSLEIVDTEWQRVGVIALMHEGACLVGPR